MRRQRAEDELRGGRAAAQLLETADVDDVLGSDLAAQVLDDDVGAAGQDLRALAEVGERGERLVEILRRVVGEGHASSAAGANA